jgi:hypothetical protein
MSTWQPIETAPKDGTKVLIGAFYASGAWNVEVGYYDMHRAKNPWRPFVGQSTQPTHWMPVPNAPGTN